MNEKNLNQLEDFLSKQLEIKVVGSVQQSNLAEFEEQALAVLGTINTKLESDDDFAEAEKNIKDCQLVENRIHNERQSALNGTADIAALIATTERLEGKFRQMRLNLDSAVKTEKERRKKELISAAMAVLQGLAMHSPVKHGFRVDQALLQDAIRGKKSIAKMQEAVDGVVEEQTEIIGSLEVLFLGNTDKISESEKSFPGLYPDKATLALSPESVVEATIESRVATFRLKQQDLEAKKAAQEEADKIARESIPESVVEPTPGPMTQIYQRQGWFPDTAHGGTSTPIETPTVPAFTIPTPPSFPEPFTTSQFLPPTPPCLQRYRLELVAETPDIAGLLVFLRNTRDIVSVKVLKWD